MIVGGSDLDGLSPILLVVPTGDSSPGTPGGSVIVQPSCVRDVWAWLHSMRTGADLSDVESVERAAAIELEAFAAKQKSEKNENENENEKGKIK